MFFASKKGYFGLPKGESNIDLVDEQEVDDGRFGQRELLLTRRPVTILISGWVVSGVLLVLLLLKVWSDAGKSDYECLQRTSSYSPILLDTPHTLHEVRLNGSFHFPSIYRGEPSPEVDAAWDRLSMLRPLDISLTDQEFLRIGQSVETAARNSPEHGGGFYLQVEFSHQLHCVNLLRKVSYFKYDYYKARDPDFIDKIDLFKVHIDHCTEMLRQFVMCHADVGLVTAHWIDQRKAAWPDFNTKKVCRDFDGILKWAQDHQLPRGTPMRPTRPQGAPSLPSPP